MKIIDRFAGTVAARILPISGAVSYAGPNKSILIIRPGGIGDAVLLVPVIRFLKERFPDAAIDILAERRNAAVFDLTADIRRVMRYDVPSEFVAALRNSYDVVIDTEQWHRLSAVVARLIRASIRIGFDTNERRRMFNYPVSYAHNEYEVASFLRLLEPLGIACGTMAVPWLTVPQEAAEKVGELLTPLGKSRFVVIFPGASISERRWGWERFRMVAERLAEEQVPVVVVGGAADAADGESIVRGIPGLNLAGSTTLAETAAVIARADVLLSGDSGILHVGVGLDIPTVSLFGSGIAAKWAPRGERHVVINKRLTCSPCTRFGYTAECPYNARCMKEITPDELIYSLRPLLHRTTSQTV